MVMVVLLIALARFGDGYRAFGVLFLPAGIWLSLKREPEQKQIRPAIRVLGWLFICLAVVILVASVFAITAGR